MRRKNDINLSDYFIVKNAVQKEGRSKGDEITAMQNEGQALRKTQWTVMSTEKN